MNAIKRLVSSKYFFLGLIAFFLLQGVWYATSINHGIPADEVYHVQFIEEYAGRPLLSGPIINDQADRFHLGDLERTPSYLYHYLLSFVHRVTESFGLSDQSQILALRMVNLLFGVLSLVLVRKIIMAASGSKLFSNIVVLTTSLTGMFVWISAAVNYDNLSLLTFLLFTYLALLLLRKPSVILLSSSIIVSLLAVLIKVTIAPTILLLAAICLMIMIYRRNQFLVSFKKSWAGHLSTDKLQLFIVGILLVVSLLIFTERVIGNLVSYGSVSPKCDQIHSVESCLNHFIYKRGIDQRVKLEESISLGVRPEANIAQFTDRWPTIMYERLYYYFGHKTFGSNPISELAKVALVLLVVVALSIKKLPVLKSNEEKILLAITIFYIAQLFLYNMKAYVKFGEILGGYQGRYLLPVIPFAYYFIFQLINSARNSLSGGTRRLFTVVAVIIVIAFTALHFPVLLFVLETDSTWFTENIQHLNESIRQFVLQIIT